VRTPAKAFLAVFPLALAAVALAVPSAGAISREPIRVLHAELTGQRLPAAHRSSRRGKALAARLARVATRENPSLGAIASSAYGSAELAEVESILRGLDHGAELAQLSVYVATPEEIATICGATVIACYRPEGDEMIVSGLDRTLGGVPRAFAIAHEYGHHIANSQEGGAIAPLGGGTIRWATYERVCQLTRANRLFPGNQAGHYWENPEEAFAETYATLADPTDRVSWQFTDLLRPTPASLAKLQADVAHPWSGPVSQTWLDTLTADEGPGQTFGAERKIKTPLDGSVEVTLSAPAGTALVAELRDESGDRVLTSARTDPEGSLALRYSNCGHDDLRLVLRGPAASEISATISHP
jgi:hypothetical protein